MVTVFLQPPIPTSKIPSEKKNIFPHPIDTSSIVAKYPAFAVIFSPRGDDELPTQTIFFYLGEVPQSSPPNMAGIFSTIPAKARIKKLLKNIFLSIKVGITFFLELEPTQLFFGYQPFLSQKRHS